MACYDGLGNIGDGRPVWTGDFNGDGKAEVLFYFPGDRNWWLGTFNGNTIAWTLVGNTTGFGQIWDGRPIWIGDFAGTGRDDVLFYFPGDRNWWLGQFGADGQLTWTRAGNTSGFGQVWDGRPFWIGDFSGDGKADVLFYFPGDRSWWLGRFAGNQLVWNLAGDTAGFGQVGDGRPIWTADFAGTGRDDVLFYFPGDRNWWLGQFGPTNQLSWTLAGNTAGFGQIWDGRPFWVGDFSGDGKADVLFHFPGDKNWWLGRFVGTQLNWTFAGNTSGFGNVADGRPIWTGDFAGTGKSDVLFYFPGDRNWWLGQFGANQQLGWNLAGNTAGFGQVWDGRPFWTNNFNGGQRDVLFYFPGDGNWWLGSFAGSTLGWAFAGNTGRPHRSRVRLHIKDLVGVEQAAIDTQLAGLREVFSTAGVLVDLGTTERLNLPLLTDLDVGTCVMGVTTAEQNQLFANRNNAGANDICLYIVRSTAPPLGGCAAHPPGRPGCVIVPGQTRWVSAHEVGHVLGLLHLNDANRLMNPNQNWTNLPPDLVATEAATMDSSPFSINC